MYQERDYSSIDWGDGLHKYYSFGGQTNLSLDKVDPSLMMKNWLEGMSKAATYPSPFPTNILGKERLTSYRGPRRNLVNNVVHHKTKAHCYPYAYYAKLPVQVGYCYYMRKAQPQSWGVINTNIPRIKVSDNARAAAWYSMQPRYKGGIDLLRSLVELKDFRDIMRFVPQLNKMSYSINRLRGLHRKHGADPSKTLSQAYLAWIFAFKPLITDFALVAAQCARSASIFQQQYAELGSIWQKSHFLLDQVNEEFNAIPKENHLIISLGGYRTEVARATLRYKYTYAMQSDTMNFLKYWGLTGSALTVWNLIPFSFLQDLIFTLNKSIQYMTLDPATKLGSFLYMESIKSQSGYGYFFNKDTRNSRVMHNGMFYGPSRPILPLTGVTTTYYERKLRTPFKGTTLPYFKELNKGSIPMLAALARCFIS